MRNLLLFFSNRILACLAVAALLNGCGSVATRGESQDRVNEPPSLPRDYENALALMQSGNYPAAITALRGFIRKQPELAGPWLNLGIAYERNDEPDAAMEALATAIELNPDNAVAHQQLGILYRARGEFDAALDAYDRALKLNPGYALAHRNIGILYDLYLQQPALALDHYRKYVELTGDTDSDVNAWVADLERRLGDTQARMKQ
ncbi:MAG: tetratricopeptide repeat protein [Thiogranum sp.]|nr:tetratricopeptide repeat protein [Thiogranum sp.]